MEGVHHSAEPRDDALGAQHLPPTPGIAGFSEEPLDWCATFLKDLEADAGMGVSAGRPKHRRTYSAPPTLKQIDVPPFIPTTGKRPARSPRFGAADPSAGLGLVHGLVDPLQDIRSPAYKKQVSAEELPMEVSDDASFSSKERAAPAHYGHVRSSSFDAAIFNRRGDAARAGMLAPAAAGSGEVPSWRGEDTQHNHVPDAPANDVPAGGRDSKTIPWTSAEDKVICEGVEMHGFKWSLISLSLPGRTDNAVRNRWHRLEQARKWREEVQAQYQAAQADGSAPAQMPGSAYPGYKCRRCGQPKRGHVCPYEDTTQLPAPRPLPPPQPPRASKDRSVRAHNGHQKHQPHHMQQPPPMQPPAHYHHQPPPPPHPSQHALAARAQAVARDTLHTHQHAARGHAAGQAPERSVRRDGAPHLHRPSSAPSIAVVPPPASSFEARAGAGLGIPQAAPSPMRLASDIPLSAHLRSLESGMDHDAITVGDLEDLIFGSLPLDLTDMPSHSPLKTMALVGSPLRFTRIAPPAPLPTIPSGEAVGDQVPSLERQSTPQAIHAN